VTDNLEACSAEVVVVAVEIGEALKRLAGGVASLGVG
jgi:hypothetical protein